MNYAFVVQARLGSTRLPGKILKPFYGNQSILDLMVHKLSAISNIPVIIATTNSVINEPIEKKALALGVKCFRGEENDVLKRFIDVAEYFDIQGIFRICSDNPFLDVHAARQLVEIAMKSCNDYISFDIDGTPSIKTHFGFWGEFVTLDALKRVIGFTDDLLYREHVTNYIYSHPELFNIQLTIDTLEDFSVAQRIYRDLQEKRVEISIEVIVDYVRRHAEYIQLMKQQIKKNSK